MRQAAFGLALILAVHHGFAVPAFGEQGALQVFRVELETEVSKDKEAKRDYYISGGKANGLKESMILDVFRPKTIRAYDQAKEYNIKVLVGQLRVMKIFDKVAIARIHAIAPSRRNPVVTYRTVMVGDHVVPRQRGVTSSTEDTTAKKDDSTGMMLPLSMNVPFEFDEWHLTDQATEVLESVLDKFSALQEYDLILEGHTCSIGADTYNQQLARKRVQSVEEHLLAKGVPSTRIHIGSYGEKVPAVANDTAENKRRNRRVEVSFAHYMQIPSSPDSPPAVL